jgi:hypothetical protein
VEKLCKNYNLAQTVKKEFSSDVLTAEKSEKFKYIQNVHCQPTLLPTRSYFDVNFKKIFSVVYYYML